MTNIERAAEITEDHLARWEVAGYAPNSDHLAQALADAGLLTHDPQIIRTVEELEALDPDSLVLDCTGHLMTNRDRLPAVVVAPAEQVRAARKALEEA